MTKRTEWTIEQPQDGMSFGKKTIKLEVLNRAPGAYLWVDDHGVVAFDLTRVRQLRDALTELLQQEAKQPEPVWWIHTHPTVGGGFSELADAALSDAEKAAGWTETPLYAEPPHVHVREEPTEAEIGRVQRVISYSLASLKMDWAEERATMIVDAFRPMFRPEAAEQAYSLVNAITGELRAAEGNARCRAVAAGEELLATLRRLSAT
jgi:hypothetical protein